MRAGCPRAYPKGLRSYTLLPFFSTHLTTFSYSTMYDLLPFNTFSLSTVVFLYPLSFALLNAFLLAIPCYGLQEISSYTKRPYVLLSFFYSVSYLDFLFLSYRATSTNIDSVTIIHTPISSTESVCSSDILISYFLIF